MEILYVITNNDELQYVEFDEVKISKEMMIKKLQKSDKVKEIYEGISNFGPIGLLWEKEENDDEEKIHEKVMFDSCMNDADTTTLDALIEDEAEAIKAYGEAIKEAQFEEAIGIYEHIKGEEEEHLKELMELKERVSRG